MGGKDGKTEGRQVAFFGPRMRLRERVSRIERMEGEAGSFRQELGDRKPGRVLNPFERYRLWKKERQVNLFFGVFAVETEALKRDAEYCRSLAALAVETLSFECRDARAFADVDRILKGEKPSQTREGWIALLLTKTIKPEFLAPEVLEEWRKSEWEGCCPKGARAKALWWAVRTNKSTLAWKGVSSFFRKKEGSDARAQGVLDVLRNEFLHPDVFCNAVKYAEGLEKEAERGKNGEKPHLKVINGGLSQKRK